MDAAELRVEERPLEVDAQTASALRRAVLFELVRRFGDLVRRVNHRLPRRRHHRGDEAAGPHRRVGARGDVDGVTLVSVEEQLARPVGVDVDEAGRDRRALGYAHVARPVGLEQAFDASGLDRDATSTNGSVAERNRGRAQDVGVSHEA